MTVGGAGLAVTVAVMTSWLTLVAVLVGIAAAVTVVRAHRRGLPLAEVTARSVFVLLALVGAAVVVAAGMAAGGRLGLFGFAHLGYLLGTVTVPAAGAALAWAVVRARPGSARLLPAGLAVVMLLPAPLGVWATHVAPFRLQVDRVDVSVPGMRGGRDPVRIGVLSDLQTGRVTAYERDAVSRLLATEPDLILVPGDLFQGSVADFDRELEAMQELLGRLEAPHGVYLVPGDVDPEPWVDALVEGTSIEVLRRDVVDLTVGDRRIRLGGHSLEPYGPDAREVRDRLLDTPDDVITVLLAHRPDTVLGLPPGSRIDLTVAGHTHGGQIVLPGFGPLVTMSDVPRHVARGGLHEVAGNPIYVSAGVGMERGSAPQVRLFCPPEIGVITIG